MATIYHVSLDGETDAACGEAKPGEPVVPMAEALGEGGRHFNCNLCHMALTDGRRHSRPTP